MRWILAGLLVLVWPFAAHADFAKPADRKEVLLLLEAALRNGAPDLTITLDLADESLLVTGPSGEEMRVYPDNLFLALRQAESDADRATLMREHAANSIRIMQEADNEGRFDPTHLLPVLRSPDSLPVQSGFPMWRFSEGIVGYWVIDSETSIASVSVEQMERAGLTQEKLADVALANLTAKAASATTEQIGALRMIVLDGYYESSLLLVPDLWFRRDLYAGTIIAAVPARDILLWGDGEDPAQLEAMRRQATEYAATLPHPISAEVLRWDGAAWKTLPDDAALPTP